jgi:hypothetical protein
MAFAKEKDMSAFLLAVFNDYATAARVRTALVVDGFPTDRVELTADCDHGRAAFAPGGSTHDKFMLYFRTLFRREDEKLNAEHFTECVDCGAAIIAVHPRGIVETERATQILESAGPREVARHDLEHQTLEFAAARNATPWARNFWVESSNHPDCIYCWMYEQFSRNRRVS